MNLISIKRTNDMKLKGVQIDAEWRDKTLAAVTLTDEDGNVLRLVTTNYMVQAYIAAPVEKKTVHVITGTVPTLGTPVKEIFETEREARLRKEELEYARVIENSEVKAEEIDIPF